MSGAKIGFGILLTVGLVLVVGCSVFLGLFPGIIKSKIEEEIPLNNGSDAYERWQKTPVPLYMKFSFFVLKNNDYKNLSDIELVEQGPYVYKEERSKENVNFTDDDYQMSYNERKNYTFQKDMSGDGLDETDYVTIVNFPMMGIAFNDGLDDKSKTAQEGFRQFGAGFPPNQTSLFITVPVEEILFNGVKFGFFDLIKGLYPSLKMTGRFSVINGKELLEEEWTIYTGKDKVNDIGQISRFDYKNNLTNTPLVDNANVSYVWKNDEDAKTCNKLKGTDGTMFAPDIQKDDTLYAFEPQLCRSVYFKYWEESEVRDISTYRFKIPEEYFQSPKKNPDNSCYCNRNPDQCDVDGMLDITHCQRRSLGAPIIMSLPYWLNSDPKSNLLKQFRTEIKPPGDVEINEKNFGTYLDIEPMTGNTLQAFRRMQMSIRLSGNKNPAYNKTIPQLYNSDPTKEYYVPVFWIEETAEADEDQADVWKSMVGNKKKLGNGLAIAGAVVGAIMAIAAIYLFIRNR